ASSASSAEMNQQSGTHPGERFDLRWTVATVQPDLAPQLLSPCLVLRAISNWPAHWLRRQGELTRAARPQQEWVPQEIFALRRPTQIRQASHRQARRYYGCESRRESL